MRNRRPGRRTSVVRGGVVALVVLSRAGEEVASWPVVAVTCGRPHLCLVDELARLQLAARRANHELALRDVSPELRELLELLGLTGALGVQPVGEPEGGEEVGVEEVVVPDDPVP